MRISSSSVDFSSFEARLNSARLLPSDLPNSGSFRGPKMIKAITRITSISGMPMEPINAYSLRSCETVHYTLSKADLLPPVGLSSTIFHNMRTYRSISVAALAIALSVLAVGLHGGRVFAVQDGMPERYKVF